MFGRVESVQAREPQHAHGMHDMHGVPANRVGEWPWRRHCREGAAGGGRVAVARTHSLPLRTVPSPPQAPKTLPNEVFIESMGQEPTVETEPMLDQRQAHRLPRA